MIVKWNGTPITEPITVIRLIRFHVGSLVTAKRIYESALNNSCEITIEDTDKFLKDMEPYGIIEIKPMNE